MRRPRRVLAAHSSIEVLASESDRTMAPIKLVSRILQYLQLVTSPPGGAVFKSRSTILGAYIW